MYSLINKSTSKAGFSLLELILTIAVLGLLTVTAVPAYQTLQSENDLSLAASSISESLEQAKLRAEAVDGDSAWGVKINQGVVLLFKGESYTNRDPNEDRTKEIPTTITVSGTTEIAFHAFTGTLSSGETITLKHNSGKNRSLTINTLGMIEY